MYLIKYKLSEFILPGRTKPGCLHLFDKTKKDVASRMYITIGLKCTLYTCK